MPLNGLPPYGILGYNIVLDTGVGLANRDSSATLVATTTGFSLTGDAVLSGDLTLPAGTAAAPSLNGTGSLTTGLYWPSAGVLGVSVAGALDFSVSANSLNVLAGSNVALADSAQVRYGDAADIAMTWDGTKFAITQAAPNSAIDMGVDGAGIDVIFRGDTASAAMTWDQSADALAFTGVAKVTGLRTAPGTTSSLITGATTLVLADSGGVFTIAQTSAYDIAVPDPTTGGGCVYKFVVTTAGAFNVTISTTGASTFVGTIINDVTSVIPATGSTLTIASGVAAIGDTITITSLSLGLYLVEAVTSANGGITIA